jgi:hypothetical protein
MAQTLTEKWQSAFLKIIQQHEHSTFLKEAALQERLGDWTKALTSVVIVTSEEMGWQASAKGHYLQMLPVGRSEYLALDVMAFPDGEKRWRFPVAVLELENSKDDDRIAYSLWKVMCVRADLRIVFCYRRSTDEGSRLISFLRDEVIHAMGLINRINLEGETLLVVGSRDSSSTFPYGFFKWWHLDTNTGTFSLL